MPKDSQLEESKPGYLHCLSKASLKPTVTWYRNGVSISEVRRWGKPLLLTGHFGQVPAQLLPLLLLFLALLLGTASLSPPLWPCSWHHLPPTGVRVHDWLSLAAWLGVSPPLSGQ